MLPPDPTPSGAQAVAPVAPQDFAASVYPFAFDGRLRDYFRIWIVSVCLSLFTLGVYSAWGKVRKKRYLYAHTLVAGSGFDYRAHPLAILKGRIMALFLLGGFAASGHFLPLAQIGFVLLLLVLMPWIVVAGHRFNASNTAYRNVRFGFTGRVGEAARVFLGLGVLVVPTLGLAYPYYRLRRARFIVGHHRYGADTFATHYDGGSFYAVYVLAGLMLLLLGGITTGGMMAASLLAGGDRSSTAFIAFTATFYGSYLLAFSYLRARTGNLVLNGAQLGALRFQSSLRARHLAWIYLSNIAAIVASAGLATPWATLRMARYRAERLTLLAGAPLETFGGSAGDRASATASEVSDLFDVDISL